MRLAVANPLNVYASSHINSQTVCKAFAEGSSSTIVPPAPLLPGDVAMYGCLRGLLPTLRQAQKEGRDWIYLDRGYLGASRGTDYSGYFRATWNNYQIDGQGESDGKRLAKLKLDVKPWRTSGRHVVFCPPSEVWCGILGIDYKAFMADTIHDIKAGTERPLVVRHKLLRRPLESDLADAWCLVTYSSNAAVEAAIAGIPVICLGRCAASAISGTLKRIDSPPTPERMNWLGVLADNQWTLAEMRDGTCWKQLRELP